MMRGVFVSTMLVAMVLAQGGPLCPIFSKDLPSFCTCKDEKDSSGLPGAIATCVVRLPENLDTVTVVAEILPCDAQASINLKISESKFGVSYSTSIAEGSGLQHIAIPGVSLSFPGVPVGVGLYADVLVSGNADSIKLAAGLDLCAEIPFVGTECGDKITSELPIWLLNSTYTFSTFC